MRRRPDRAAGAGLKARLVGTALFTGIGAALGLASQALMARLVGADRFGVYSFVLSAVGLAQVWLALDFGQAVARFVPGYWRAGNRAALREFRALGLRIVGVTSTIGVVVVVSARSVWEDRVPSATLLVLGAALAVAMTLLQLDYLFLVAIGESRRAVLLQQVLRPALVIGLAGLGILMSVPLDYVGIGSAWLAVAIVVFLTRRQVGRIVASIPTPDEADALADARPLRTVWLRFSTTMLASSAAQGLITSQLDVVLVGVMVAARDSGVYAAGAQLALVASLLTNVIANVLNPPFAAAHDAGTPDEARVALGTLAMAQAGAAVTGIVAVAIIGPIFLRAYGAGFGQSYALALLLSIANGVASLFGVPASLILSTMGAHRKFALANVTIGIFAVLLGIGLVSQLGTVGAAWATLGVAVVRSGVLQWLARGHAPGMLSYRLAGTLAMQTLARVRRVPIRRS